MKTILKSRLILPKILFSLIKIITIFLLFTQLTCSKKIKNEDQIQFEEIHFYDGVSRRVFADFDGDGNVEYVQRTSEKGAILIDFDGSATQTACHLVGTLKLGRFQALDFTGDLSPEIFLPVKRKNSTWVEVVEVVHSFGEIDCKYIFRTDSISGIDIDNNDEWDGEIEHLQVLDVNEDGQKDILAGISTGYDKNPRGIYAFDGKSGEQLWSFALAGRPCPIICSDVTGDGEEEILFGAWAPDNVVTCGDMDDSHSYLICLNKQGQLLWKHEMGGIFFETNYSLTDVNDDGTSEIIATYATGNAPNNLTEYELQIREGKAGKVMRSFPLQSRFNQPFIANLNRDGKDEIIIGNNDGWIYVFDNNLELINNARPGTELKPCKICEIVDLQQDVTKEIIVFMKNKFLILNSKLEILGQYQSNMIIDQLHYFKHPLYGDLLSLVQSSESGLHNSVLLEIKYSPGEGQFANLVHSKYGIGLLLIIFVLGIISAFFLLTIVPNLIRNFKTTPFKKLSEHRDSLLQTLSVFGHHPTANKNLDRLCFLFKNPREDETGFVEYQNRVQNAITTFFNLTLDQVEDIIKKSKSAKIGTPFIDKLKNDFNKLRSVLTEYKNTDTSLVKTNNYTQQVPELISTIELNIEAIKAELNRYYQSDIFTITKEVIASFSNDLKAEEIDFKNLILEGDITARAFIGKNDLTTIFQNLIRNAIESMKQSPIKELLVKINGSENKIFVEITDTGCGIEQENLVRIFDREFSTKSDGGFGLYHARTALNKYGGKIKVANSKPGKGTTMRIEIKRA